MTADSEGTVTNFLAAIAQGDRDAGEQLWESVYQELRSIAGRLMAGENAGHTLQPTALVHEAYARLLGGAAIQRHDRAYFFRSAAEAMRRILIEHARRKKPSVVAFAMEQLTAPGLDATRDRIDELDAALDELAAHDRAVSDVIMMRFFAGLTIDETAELLELSPRTVKRYWTYARTWLYRRLSERPPGPTS